MEWIYCPIAKLYYYWISNNSKANNDNFGIKSVFMTSMQALSGAGRSPGVIALDILDNVNTIYSKRRRKSSN